MAWLLVLAPLRMALSLSLFSVALVMIYINFLHFPLDQGLVLESLKHQAGTSHTVNVCGRLNNKRGSHHPSRPRECLGKPSEDHLEKVLLS